MDMILISIIAFATMVWTGYQELRFWKMCKNCPYFLSSEEKKIRDILKSAS